MTARVGHHFSVTSHMMTGAQIRAARGFLDWSVRDLGKKAKVHFNTVHAIERGKSVAKLETLAIIQKVLEKTGIEFTNGKEPGANESSRQGFAQLSMGGGNRQSRGIRTDDDRAQLLRRSAIVGKLRQANGAASHLTTSSRCELSKNRIVTRVANTGGDTHGHEAA
jgi:transcriptional regulator with XRE-family HTH domain